MSVSSNNNGNDVHRACMFDFSGSGYGESVYFAQRGLPWRWSVHRIVAVVVCGCWMAVEGGGNLCEHILRELLCHWIGRVSCVGRFCVLWGSTVV